MEKLLKLQLVLRELLFVRPFDIEAIESAGIKLCDEIIKYDEKQTRPTKIPTDKESV